jgi:putative ABC transport system permease protein
MNRVPGATLIRALSRLVPSSHRDQWSAEWLAELTHSWHAEDAPWKLRRRALGAALDALWLRRHHGAFARGSSMFSHDVRFAARSLLRRPGFASVVVVTLALCIGASTAVFSIVEAVLLRGLQYRDLDRLVAVWSKNPKENRDRYDVSVGDYFDWRDRNRSFEQLAGFFSAWNATYTAADVAERLDVGAVSANFLRTLGVRPMLGRDFLDGEDRRDAVPVVLISHHFWSRVFYEDPSAVGKTIALDGKAYTVIGVMDGNFTFPQARVDVIAPLAILGSYIDRRQVHLLSVIGRLRGGVTIEQARQDMQPIVDRLRIEHPQENAGLGVTVNPLAADLLGDVRGPITILFAAVCAVLLIGCANVANLMLVRATGRRQELGVRAAMGAEPRAIARQLLTESALIASISGILGIAIAFIATRVLTSMLPASIAKIGVVRVDGAVLLFTLAVCVLVALLCGIGPALRGARSTVSQALNDAARGSSRGRAARRVHGALVVVEMALATVLVVSAGLLVNSFARLTRTQSGFRSDHVVRMRLALPTASYPRIAKRDQFYEALLARVRALPGVRAAGSITRFPLHDGGNITTQVIVEGAPVPADNQYPASDLRQASPGYFKAMGIPLLAGRDFSDRDVADSASRRVAVLNRTAAQTFFHTTDAVGKRFQLSDTSAPVVTVVGVVGDVHDASLKETPHPQLFLSTRQAVPSSVSLAIQYTGSPDAVVAGVRRIVAELDSSLPVYDVQTIEAVLDRANVGERFTTSLLSSFALLALVLAALGTYGVIAYGVAERTREIGVRMALGARADEVLTMVLREGAALFALALVIAAGASWWATRALSGLLYGVAATDPATLVAAVAAMGFATGLACYLPARRASRVDPTIAMRA